MVHYLGAGCPMVQWVPVRFSGSVACRAGDLGIQRPKLSSRAPRLVPSMGHNHRGASPTFWGAQWQRAGRPDVRADTCDQCSMTRRLQGASRTAASGRGASRISEPCLAMATFVSAGCTAFVGHSWSSMASLRRMPRASFQSRIAIADGPDAWADSEVQWLMPGLCSLCYMPLVGFNAGRISGQLWQRVGRSFGPALVMPF